MENANGMSEELVEIAAEVVSAYVSNNPLPAADLPQLIRSVHAAFAGLSMPAAPAKEERAAPAVNPKKSVFDDYIICLEDGKKFKSLKRHLMTHYKLTPEAYREKWGLDSGYPMVAPNYAKQRSELAKQMGLGRKA
ncbi:MAG: MucR family transcriptional regulator [Rhizobiaceae bacterium]|jgi:predicted transcriptional regulator|nr:MucR family transcriptional regulator [Rhizobiaceae bacterium]